MNATVRARERARSDRLQPVVSLVQRDIARPNLRRNLAPRSPTRVGLALALALAAACKADGEGGTFDFQGDSDALIVRGLIAILHALYSGVPVGQVRGIDADAELARLGLEGHLSAQRSNGLRAMVERIRLLAASHAA